MKRFWSVLLILTMLTGFALADEATPTDVDVTPEAVAAEAPAELEEAEAPETPEAPDEPEEPEEPEPEARRFAVGYVALPAGTMLFADEAMTVPYGVLAEDAVGYRTGEHAVRIAVDGEAVLVYTLKGEPAEAPGGEADAVFEGFALINAVLAAEEPAEPAQPAVPETEQPEAAAGPAEQPETATGTEPPMEAEPVPTEVPEPQPEEQPEQRALPAEPVREPWQAAPAVTAEQTGEGEVTFTITPAGEAEKYSIYEIAGDGSAVFVRNISTVVYVLKDVAEGEHLYRVQARRTVNGVTVKGDWCEPVSVTVGKPEPAAEAPQAEEAPETEEPDDGIRIEDGSFILATADYEITFTPCEGGVGAVKYTQIHEARTVTIPAEVRGNPVLYIGEGFMDGNAAVESVILPATIRELKDAAFRNCANLLFGN